MRADERDGFEKIRQRCKAFVTGALVVEFAAAQQFKLRPVKCVAVDLSVIELDGADGLRWREEMPTTITQAHVAH